MVQNAHSLAGQRQRMLTRQAEQKRLAALNNHHTTPPQPTADDIVVVSGPSAGLMRSSPAKSLMPTTSPSFVQQKSPAVVSTPSASATPPSTFRSQQEPTQSPTPRQHQCLPQQDLDIDELVAESLGQSPSDADVVSVDDLVSEFESKFVSPSRHEHPTHSHASPSDGNAPIVANTTESAKSAKPRPLTVGVFTLAGADIDSIGRSLIRASSKALCVLHFYREHPLKYGDLLRPTICSKATESFDVAVLAIPEEARPAISGPVGRYSKLLAEMTQWVRPDRLIFVVTGDRVFKTDPEKELVSKELAQILRASRENSKSRHREVEAFDALEDRRLFSWSGDASALQSERLRELFSYVATQPPPPPPPVRSG